jgi:AraC-like DNA-binding protein
MDQIVRKEQANLWHDRELGDLEILHATYIKHAFARHAHETFAIGIVENGYGTFTSRGTQHIATPSDIFIIHPGEMHDGQACTSAGYTYYMIYPGLELFQRFAIDPMMKSSETLFFPHTIIKDEDLYKQLLTFHTLIGQGSDHLTRESTLSQILNHFATTHADQPIHIQPPGWEPRAVAQVKDYIHANYAQSISLDQLSTLTQLHPSYLIRTFHAAMDIPPHVYLTQVRILQAKRLLLDGVPAGRVAMETGFADQSHLTRHFKRVVGVTPGHYYDYARL